MNLTRLRRGVRRFVLAASIVSAVPAGAAPLGVYDGNGVLLGTYLGSAVQSVEFATPTGYIARVRVDDEASSEPNGTIQGLFVPADTYDSANCSGPALTPDAVAGRLVRMEGSQEQLGYVPRDAAPVLMHAGAVISGHQSGGGQCVTRTLSRDTTFLPAYPNDPQVTGIQAGVVPLPIKIAFIDGVFADGFERAA